MISRDPIVPMDDNGLVIHLPIKPSDIQRSTDSMINYSGPAPYDHLTSDISFAQFSNDKYKDVNVEDIYREKFISEKIIDSSISVKNDEQKLIERNIKNIMFEFMDSNSRNLLLVVLSSVRYATLCYS